MRIHHWLMPLFIAAATEAAVPATKADEPEVVPRPGAGALSPDVAIDAKDDSVSQDSASELHGTYNFLLEVGGITPAEPSRDRKRSPGLSRRHDPRAARPAIDSTE
jgi:hypothetical protein